MLFSVNRSPKMRHVKEEESSFIIEEAIDLTSVVEELHALNSQEINKLLKDSENFIIQHFTKKGSLVQIDLERLAWSLPLHLIAVLVSPGRGDHRLIYLLRGFRLLHSLCDLASWQTRLEQILLEEAKVTEQILDLVFYMLVVLARCEQDHHTTDSIPLLHSVLVACSLHLLTGCVSSQWQDLVQVLLAHPKVDVFMDVAFNAVCMDIKYLQIKLSGLNADFSCKKSSPSDAERTLHYICHQCEASLQFLQSLCQQKLFQERLLRNKELCKNGGILFLAQAVLKLEIPYYLQSYYIVVAAVSRLKSKILSLLLQLCETETISYLDEAASSPSSMQLAKTVALEILGSLKMEFDEVPKHLDSIGSSFPRGVVLLNSMRLIDIFSDDSNFRSFIMVNITRVLAEIFSLPQEEFLSSWCSADLPVKEEDATLEYDPFVAAGLVLTSVSAGFGTSFPTSGLMNEIKNNSPFILKNIPQASYVQQRTSLLVKIIANLHCFVPNICEEQERNLFFNKFIESLQNELPKSSSGFPFTCDIEKTARVCKNLGSLVDHAGSLIPNFLNEEDVQLLSVFVKQLESLVPSAKPEACPIQEQVQENKFEGSLCWEKFSNHGVSVHHQEAQSTGGCASPLTRGDLTALEVASELNDKNGSFREGMSNNSTFKEVGKFNISNRGLKLPDDVMNLDGSRRNNKVGTSGSALEPFREIGKDVWNVETSCSELSYARGKNSVVCHMVENDDCSKLAGNTRESSLAGLQENDTKTMQWEKGERMRRKRNIMNDKQISLIEHVLLDEPEMHRNAALLQTWADKLGDHGWEITSSQLKNWLNNRKAKLARAAREARIPSEAETAFPEKSGGMGMVHFYDSPESHSEDLYAPSSTRGGSSTSTPKSGGDTLRTCGSETSEIASTDFVDLASQQSTLMDYPSL